jgi:hypothetical protein
VCSNMSQSQMMDIKCCSVLLAMAAAALLNSGR